MSRARVTTCPACVGVGVRHEWREGYAHEEECWACRGLGAVPAGLLTLGKGILLEPGSALLDG